MNSDNLTQFLWQIKLIVARIGGGGGGCGSGVEWSGVEWSGVEWSGVEWSGGGGRDVGVTCSHQV